MAVSFGMGIIKGLFKDSNLIVLLENPKISKEKTVIIEEDKLIDFLLENDYAIYKKKNGEFSFEKIILDNRLGEYLKAKGISQSYVASKLGVSRSYINQLCNASNLEIATAYRILKVLDIPINEIETVFPAKNLEIFDF